MERKDDKIDDTSILYRMDRRTFVKIAGATAGALALGKFGLMRTAEGAIVPQVPLPGNSIPQFVDPLPALNAITAGLGQIELQMKEFMYKMLPATFVPAAGTYTGTWVWGYLTPNQVAGINPIPSFIGPVIVASRGTPTEIKWVNDLGNADPNALISAGSRVLAYTQSTDRTLHWADPLNDEANTCAMNIKPGLPPISPCNLNYDGPIPGVPHLHGGEVPPVLDGGPDAWFTSDGLHQGHAYYTRNPGIDPGNSAVYSYPNSQEAAPIWFHDHTLGATRLGVYAGLAGAYILTDPQAGNPNFPAPGNLPGPIIPLVIQDRMFDINGQLFLQNIGINPEHPFWVPEFLGDVIVVNGKAWPFINVEPKRYRFLFLNGSNARTYAMDFKIQGKGKSPIFWQIGTDGGYLDNPAPIQNLVLMPGERADVIIDFAGFAPGTTMILQNSAMAPFPGGAPPQGATVGRIMQFRVQQLTSPENSFNPAGGGAIRSAPNKIVRLPGTPAGPIINATNVQNIRQLTLNEVMAPRIKVGGVQYPGGPLEVLVNNTKWEGILPPNVRTDFTPITTNGKTTYYSELPKEGETEVWEIVNLTADAHPMHLHLVQFQLIDRRNFNLKNYIATYNLAFPGGMYIPAYGPPLDYYTGNLRAVGGNPDIIPFLMGAAMPAAPNEQGWKDTIMAPPGMVTRIAVRWTPTHFDPAQAVSAANPDYFPFNPDGGHGYVWHCHIIDHEDNEMMRPTSVKPKAGVTRTYNQGTDY